MLEQERFMLKKDRVKEREREREIERGGRERGEGTIRMKFVE